MDKKYTNSMTVIHIFKAKIFKKYYPFFFFASLENGVIHIIYDRTNIIFCSTAAPPRDHVQKVLYFSIYQCLH